MGRLSKSTKYKDKRKRFFFDPCCDEISTAVFAGILTKTSILFNSTWSQAQFALNRESMELNLTVVNILLVYQLKVIHKSCSVFLI